MLGSALRWWKVWPSLAMVAACQWPRASPIEETAWGPVPRIVAVPYDHVDRGSGQFIHAEIPQCRSEGGARTASFDRLLRMLVLERVDEFRGACTEGSLRITMEVVGPFGGVVSVLLRLDEFIRGVRPYHETIAINYDWVEGRRLRLADLFEVGADIDTRLDVEDTWWSLAVDGLVTEIPPGVADCFAAGSVIQLVHVECFSDLLSPLGRRIWGIPRTDPRSR